MNTPTKQQIARADVILDRLAAEPVQLVKAKEPRRWGQPARSLHDPLVNVNAPRPVAAPAATRPTTPAPNMALSLRNSRDTTPLTGYQLAARRAGLDVNTPNLHKMSFEQMKQAAHDVNVKATSSLALKAGLQYRR